VIVTDISADPAEIERIEQVGVEVMVATQENTSSHAQRNGGPPSADIRGRV
jgi:hypothetical protein